MRHEPSSSAAGRATGPRTAAGRKRSAQNALRHGLTAQAPDQLAITIQVEEWSQGSRAQQSIRQDLIFLAEARLQISRVQVHQADLLERLCAIPSFGEDDGSGTGGAAERGDLVLTFARSLRYRAEAEARRRKALRTVIENLAAQNRRGAQYGTR